MAFEREKLSYFASQSTYGWQWRLFFSLLNRTSSASSTPSSPPPPGWKKWNTCPCEQKSDRHPTTGCSIPQRVGDTYSNLPAPQHRRRGNRCWQKGHRQQVEARYLFIFVFTFFFNKIFRNGYLCLYILSNWKGMWVTVTAIKYIDGTSQQQRELRTCAGVDSYLYSN